MIKITALNKIYRSKKRKHCHALKDVNLTLPDAGLVFVLGKSGSGKSTLLNLIGGLDNLSSGRIEVDGNDLSRFKERDFCNYRNTHIGFIFQDYHLIDELTVYENIVFSLNLRRIEDDGLVKAALERVGLAGYEERYPTELSGGEQQRVAIARAIVKRPRIILADEPTGNLDTHTARSIVELLRELARDCLILIVSHNVNDANAYADRIIELAAGRIVADRTRNPDFADRVLFMDDKLIYPEGLALDEQDIELINRHPNKSFVLRRDKFLKTQEKDVPSKKIKIENKSLSPRRELSFSAKFLKSKGLAISLASFMVAVIMVIMALAQTIVSFDGSHIVAAEMAKSQQTAILMNKTVSKELSARLDGNYRYAIGEADIDAIYDAGYKGTVYPVYNVSVQIMDYRNAAGVAIGYFHHGSYLSETLGTLIVDEAFLTDKFGKVEYLASADEPYPSGVIITDYVADAILALNTKYKNKSYDDIVGVYYFSWTMPQVYINGIIHTGYKEKHADLMERLEQNQFSSFADLYSDPAFAEFSADIYNRLGYTFTFNPNFVGEYSDFSEFSDKGSKAKVWTQRLVYNNVIESVDSDQPYAVCDMMLGDNEIMIPYQKYNELFGTEYTASTIDSFVPHTVTLAHYHHNDPDHEKPLVSVEVKVVGLANTSLRRIAMSENVFDLFWDTNLYANSLYLDGTDGIGHALDAAGELCYEPQSISVDGIHTMTRAVDVFVPLFEFISIFLYIGVIFILMNFASKMINGKMHEIGIMKALGTKNTSIGAVFGLQVGLIALLTCILSTVGYYFFIDMANEILIGSIRRIAPGHILPDLQFLIFKPAIAVMNCLLVFALAFVSFLLPMIKIKAIKPVKIIKAKE